MQMQTNGCSVTRQPHSAEHNLESLCICVVAECSGVCRDGHRFPQLLMLKVEPNLFNHIVRIGIDGYLLVNVIATGQTLNHITKLKCAAAAYFEYSRLHLFNVFLASQVINHRAER